MAVVVMSVGAPSELTRAVASILSQDTPVELVVVNSGGGDVPARLPAGVNDIKVVSFEHVVGPGAARNEGIAATTAPFIAFLAADCVAEENWVSGRLRRHRDGAAAVASSVANSHPHHPVAWASHLALFCRRLPGTPAHLAVKYGASYSRELFTQYGLFDDIRIGEDTEFHQRIGSSNAPQWAPEVRTIHANPTSLSAACRDQHRRGVRSGTFWPRNHQERFLPRVYRKFRFSIDGLASSVSGRERIAAYASVPLLALNLLIYEIGANQGKLRPDPVADRDGKARAAAKSKRWQQAHDEWMESDRLEPGRTAPLLGRGEALMKLGRFAEAEEVFSQVRERWPKLLAGHEGCAIAAARTGRRELALDAWTEADRLMPGQPRLLNGRGCALLELRRGDEAEAIFKILLERFPERPAGYQGMAGVAMQRCQWPLALANHKELWTRFADVEAIRKKVTLLVGLNRISEAGTVVEMLQSAKVDAFAYVNAALPFLEANHDRQAMLRLLEMNQERVVNDSGLLQKQVTVLTMLGRAAEALPLIRRSRAGTESSRRILRLTALVRDRRHDDARKDFQKIWNHNKVGEIPLFLHSSLVTAAQEKGGPALAIRVLDKIDAKAPRNRTGENLRLLGLFHRARLECLPRLPAPACLQTSDAPFETQVSRLLAGRKPEIPNPDSCGIREICGLFALWRRTHPAFFPDPSFLLHDALEVASHIAGAIDTRRPFSLVRLGDGEGSLLPYRNHLEPFKELDRTATQRSWWGRTAIDDESGHAVLAEFHRAIRKADVLGIPDLYRVCWVLGTDPAMTLTPNGKNARGLLAVLDLTKSLDVGGQMLTSCHIHQSLAYWGLWELLLPRMGSVSLITCHAGLADTLAARHGVGIGGVHLIPAEHKFAPAFDNSRTDRHYPEVFEDLRAKLSGITPGEVFLVAAGMLGKIYCQWIKDAGGIAIDVGSAVDYWCGHETRSLDEATNYRGPREMMRHYQDLATEDPRIALLLRRL